MPRRIGGRTCLDVSELPVATRERERKVSLLKKLRGVPAGGNDPESLRARSRERVAG
jgi:hypothetical protein